MGLLEVLSDSGVSILEKVNFIRKFKIQEFCDKISFAETKMLLKIYEVIKNRELEA